MAEKLVTVKELISVEKLGFLMVGKRVVLSGNDQAAETVNGVVAWMADTKDIALAVRTVTDSVDMSERNWEIYSAV